MPYQLFGTDVAIAVSKKCCFLCWLLHQKLNGKGDIKFSLPGTHNNIYAWIPPLEVPDDILVELRNDLIDIVQSVVGGHSRQSSRASSDLKGYRSMSEVLKDVDNFIASEEEDSSEEED